MKTRNFELQTISKKAEIRKVGSGSNPTIQKLLPRSDKDVYPGDRLGWTIEEVRDFIKRNKRVKGESYDLAVGDNPDLPVQLSGSSKVLLGFALAFTGGNPESGTLNLTLNNEIVIDDSYVGFFGPDYTDEEYYFIPRPLSGQDDFRLSVNGVDAAYTLNVNFYYL